MIYVSRSDGSGRFRPPRVLRTPPPRRDTVRRLGVALAVVAVIASVLGVVVVLGAGGNPPA